MHPDTPPGSQEKDTQGEHASAEAARMADTLLLLRVVLADGEADARVSGTLRRIAADAWGLDDAEIDSLLASALGFGTTIATAQAVSVFRDFGLERRRMLAAELSVIASRDAEIARHEAAFQARLFEILNLRPEDRGDRAPA